MSSPPCFSRGHKRALRSALELRETLKLRTNSPPSSPWPCAHADHCKRLFLGSKTREGQIPTFHNMPARKNDHCISFTCHSRFNNDHNSVYISGSHAHQFVCKKRLRILRLGDRHFARRTMTKIASIRSALEPLDVFGGPAASTSPGLMSGRRNISDRELKALPTPPPLKIEKPVQFSNQERTSGNGL